MEYRALVPLDFAPVRRPSPSDVTGDLHRVWRNLPAEGSRGFSVEANPRTDSREIVSELGESTGNQSGNTIPKMEAIPYWHCTFRHHAFRI